MRYGGGGGGGGGEKGFFKKKGGVGKKGDSLKGRGGGECQIFLLF